jgi:hypothetical protein
MLKYLMEIWRRLQRRRVNIRRISWKEILKLKAEYYRKEKILKSAVTSSRNEIGIFKVSQFEFELHWTQKSVCWVLECFNESDHNEAQHNLQQHACPLVFALRRQRSQKFQKLASSQSNGSHASNVLPFCHSLYVFISSSMFKLL